MKTGVRILVILVLMAALLPARSVSAAGDDSLDPQCGQVAAALSARYEVGEIGGSIYCIMYPRGLRWNRDLVIFAHGYVDSRKPIGNAWDQMIRGDVNIPGLLIKLGYGFATTSYSRNGLAIQEGIDDVIALASFIRGANTGVRRIYLTGASEGGAVTAIAAEKYPNVFSGAFSTCGPIGDFQGQIQYWGNFRVGYDTAFPTNPLRVPVSLDPLYPPLYGPSSSIYIDPFIVQNWEALAAYIAYDLQTNPASGPTALALLDQLGVPYDPADLTTVGQSLLELLYYNVEATNDGRMTLVPGTTFEDLLPPSVKGSPYVPPFDISPLYPEYLGQPITADPAALAEIASRYQTTGKAAIPLVVMHTLGDPVVPSWHADLYVQKAIQQRTFLRKVIYLPVDRYGHCNFTAAEMVLGFYTMVLRTTFQPFTAAQIKSALPDAKGQREFKELKTKHNVQ